VTDKMGDSPEKRAAEQRAALLQVANELFDIGAEFIEDDGSGGILMDVPTGDQESLQIEPTEAGTFVVYVRNWSRDGGMNAEKEVAVAPAAFLGPVVRGVVTSLQEEKRDIAEAMTPVAETPAANLWRLLFTANTDASPEGFDLLQAGYVAVTSLPWEQVAAMLPDDVAEAEGTEPGTGPRIHPEVARPFSQARVSAVLAMLVQAAAISQERPSDETAAAVREALFYVWCVLSGEDQRTVTEDVTAGLRARRGEI
jgi:hypothetical protein